MELRYKRIMIMMARRKSVLECGSGTGGGSNVIGYSGGVNVGDSEINDKSIEFHRISFKEKTCDNPRNSSKCFSFCNISMDAGQISNYHQQHHQQTHGGSSGSKCGINQKNSFKVIVLLQSFLNVCYCLFLVPFRITKNSRGFYHVKTNLLQQIISTLLIVTITVFSLLDLRHYQKQQNVRERPDQTFKYATIFLVHWIPVCWIIIFWMRRSRFSNLLLISQSKFLSSKEPYAPESDATTFATGSGSSGSSRRRRGGCDVEAGGLPPTSSQLLSSQFKRWSLALKVCIFLTATKNTAFIYNEIAQNNKASLSNYLDSVTERFLYDFGLEGTSLKNSPTVLTMIGYVAAVIHFLMEFLIYLFDQLCLTAAAMVYATCHHFLDEFRMLIGRQSRRLKRGCIPVPPAASTSSSSGSQKRRKNNNDLDNDHRCNIEDHSHLDCDHLDNTARITHHCLRQISTIYLDLLAVLKGINSIFGPCVVMFFMYLYPLFIWSVFDTLQENTLLENLIRIHDMSILCCVTVVAAEGSSKVEQFRQWLFQAAMTNLAGGNDDEDGDGERDNEQDGKSSSRGNDNGEILLRFATMHREVSSEAIGLTGYKFFTVTYRFVATVAGLMTTYAIVMFQLQMMDPRKASYGNATEQLPVQQPTQHLQQQITSLLQQNNATSTMDVAE